MRQDKHCEMCGNIIPDAYSRRQFCNHCSNVRNEKRKKRKNYPQRKTEKYECIHCHKLTARSFQGYCDVCRCVLRKTGFLSIEGDGIYC